MVNKKLSLICFGITALIFLTILLLGIFDLYYKDGTGIVILDYIYILPLTSLIIALILGLKNAFLKYLYPIVFGVFGYLIPFFVLGNFGGWGPLLLSFIPAMLGLIIGASIKK